MIWKARVSKTFQNGLLFVALAYLSFSEAPETLSV